MASDEPAAQRCELRTSANLLAALDECNLEHLDVDEYRTFVLYREAVLDLRVKEGRLTAASAFRITSQGFSYRVNDPDPETAITEFCRDLVAATDTVASDH